MNDRNPKPPPDEKYVTYDLPPALRSSEDPGSSPVRNSSWSKSCSAINSVGSTVKAATAVEGIIGVCAPGVNMSDRIEFLRSNVLTRDLTEPPDFCETVDITDTNRRNDRRFLLNVLVSLAMLTESYPDE